jgi:transcription elongation GreA/GreB family factor
MSKAEAVARTREALAEKEHANTRKIAGKMKMVEDRIMQMAATGKSQVTVDDVDDDEDIVVIVAEKIRLEKSYNVKIEGKSLLIDWK